MPKLIKTITSDSLDRGPKYFAREMWIEVVPGRSWEFKVPSLAQCMEIKLYEDGTIYAISGVTFGANGDWSARKFVVGEEVMERENIWKMIMGAKDTCLETANYNFKRELLEALERGDAVLQPVKQ